MFKTLDNTNHFLAGLFVGMAFSLFNKPLTNKQLQTIRKKRKQWRKRKNKIIKARGTT